jgi:hypothetical protein
MAVNSAGDIFDDMRQKSVGSLAVPLRLVAHSPQAEVYYVPDIGEQKTAEFWMLTTDNLRIRIARTGDLTGVEKLVQTGRSKYEFKTVLEMRPQHDFFLYKDFFPVDGIPYDARKTGDQLLEQIVRYTFNRSIKGLQRTDDDMAEVFQVLAYDNLLARFNFFHKEAGIEGIHPDQLPTTVIVKAGKGCGMPCVYCPESVVPFTPLTEAEYIAQLKKTKRSLEKTVGEKNIPQMDEAFISISDVARLDVAKKQAKLVPSALRAALLLREFFPDVRKIGAFIGSHSVLDLCEVQKGPYEFEENGKKYSSSYFRELVGERDGQFYGIVRLYYGLETAHTEASKRLNKPVSYEQKRLVARLVKDARIGLKVIVQVGVLGEGFYSDGGRFYSWKECQDDTIRWINEVRPYRIMISEWQDYGNLGINELIRQRKIVPYDNPRQDVEREIKRLINGINLDARLAPNEVIERRYESFLPDEKQRIERRVVHVI